MTAPKKKRRKKQPKIDLTQRMAFSPCEVGPMFNKSLSWVYRTLIYSGRIKVITSLGHTMIPRGELERLLSEEASVYEPEPGAEPETGIDNGKNGGEA